MTITGVPGGPWREVFGQGKETKKEKKKKNVQWLTVPVCLGKKMFQVSRNLFKSRCVFAEMVSKQCYKWKHFYFLILLGNRNTITVECKLESMMKNMWM